MHKKNSHVLLLIHLYNYVYIYNKQVNIVPCNVYLETKQKFSCIQKYKK